MEHYTEPMRGGRMRVAKQIKNHSDMVKEINNIDPKLKGSPYYTETVEKIKQQHETECRRIITEGNAAIEKQMQKIRENVYRRITKAPNLQQVATMQMLNMIENITPRELQLYAGQMTDCPLALKALAQYAARQNIRIETPDIDRIIEAVDTFEWNLKALNNGFTGNENAASASVRMIMNYFMSDSDYQGTPAQSTANADKAFWNDIIQCGTPEMFDADGADTKPEIRYFFPDLDKMLSYMDKATEGMSLNEAEKTREQILKDCPDTYGAAYRLYKAEGVKTPINGEPEE